MHPPSVRGPDATLYRQDEATRTKGEKEMQERPPNVRDWREIPRSEKFERVILAVDSTRGEAEALGDEATMRRCDEQLFPFLEEMKAIAKLHEMLQEGKDQ
jgi:hypothetical protein